MRRAFGATCECACGFDGQQLFCVLMQLAFILHHTNMYYSATYVAYYNENVVHMFTIHNSPREIHINNNYTVIPFVAKPGVTSIMGFRGEQLNTANCLFIHIVIAQKQIDQLTCSDLTLE